MRVFATLLTLALPGALWAAGGGVGEGFDAEDWIAKWPVLAVVLGIVIAITSYFTAKIVARARQGG